MPTPTNIYGDDLYGYGDSRYIPTYFQSTTFNRGTSQEQTIWVYSTFVSAPTVSIGGGLVATERTWEFGGTKTLPNQNHKSFQVKNPDGSALTQQQIDACKDMPVRFYDREECILLDPAQWDERNVDEQDQSSVFPLSPAYAG